MLKSILYNIPRNALVVVEHTSHILEDEYLWLALLYHSGKLTEERTSCIFKTSALTYQGESLTRCSTYKQVTFKTIWLGIKLVNIRAPFVFRDVIIGKVTFLAVGINIACKQYLCLQIKTLQGMFNGPDATKQTSQANSAFWMRELTLCPYWIVVK